MNLIIKIIIPFLYFIFSASVFAQQKTEIASVNKIFGEAAITTNYVEKGITQSEKSWALQAGFGYKIGQQARLGIWGSSVKLPSNSENLNLRGYFDVKMIFTTNTNLTLRYDFNRYFASDLHNGTLLGIDFSPFTYHVLIEMNDNWEATRTGATWYAFRKDFNLSGNFIVSPTIGYTQLTALGYSNYFDTRLSLGYKFADMLLEFVNTFNSNSSQFNGRGEMTFLFQVSAKF